MNSPDDFHIARSKLLDAFARLECSVMAFMAVNGADVGCPTGPLGHKLDLLSKLKAGPQLSKRRKEEIAASLRAFSPYLSVRADIVHSPLHVIRLEEDVAIYRNAADANAEYPNGRMLTLKQHGSLATKVINLATMLEAKSNPPSPPRPLPAATTGL